MLVQNYKVLVVHSYRDVRGGCSGGSAPGISPDHVGCLVSHLKNVHSLGTPHTNVATSLPPTTAPVQRSPRVACILRRSSASKAPRTQRRRGRVPCGGTVCSPLRRHGEVEGVDSRQRKPQPQCQPSHHTHHRSLDRPKKFDQGVARSFKALVRAQICSFPHELLRTRTWWSEGSQDISSLEVERRP